MGPENVEFVGAEFGEILQGVEQHGYVLVVEFGFVSVCHGYFDKVRVLSSTLFKKQYGGRGTLALLASWRCLS